MTGEAKAKRRLTGAQLAALRRIRDSEVYAGYPEPSRGPRGIAPLTWAILISADLVRSGEYIPLKGRPVRLTEAGEKALDVEETPR